MPDLPADKLRFTIAETAAALGCSPDDVRRRVGSGELPLVAIRQNTWISRRTIEEVLSA